MTIQDNDPVALTYGQLTDEVERIEQIPTLSGVGAPTTATPAFYLGQGYLDTTDNKLYFCTEIDESNGYTWVEKGEKYTAGTNVQISANNEISATDTTYSDFTGTDGSTAGESGLVPAPATTDADKFLKSDGTWDEVAGGIPTDATFWGASYDTTNNSVTGTIDFDTNQSLADNKRRIYARLSNTLIIQSRSSNGNIEFNIGNNHPIAVVTLSGINMQDNKKIFRLADPTDPQDAATKNYVDSIYPVGAVFTSTSATAPTIAGGTWTEIGTQTVGSSTVHYYERTA